MTTSKANGPLEIGLLEVSRSRISLAIRHLACMFLATVITIVVLFRAGRNFGLESHSLLSSISNVLSLIAIIMSFTTPIRCQALSQD